MSTSFGQAATRHLYDARLLAQARRWDNAVYLAGYVVECSFKLLIQVYLGPNAAKAYCHDLGDMQNDGMALLRTLFPILDGRLPAVRTSGTVLDEDHPERRYSPSGRWTPDEATMAVQRAEEIYEEIVPALVLDGSITAEEI